MPRRLLLAPAVAAALLLTACSAAGTPPPSAPTLDQLSDELVAEGQVTNVDISEGPGHDDAPGLVVHFAFIHGVTPQAAAEIVDDVRSRVSAVVGNDRPEATYLSLDVPRSDGSIGMLRLHDVLATEGLARAIDYAVASPCAIIETNVGEGPLGTTSLEMVCEAPLQADAVAASYEEITALAVNDPAIDQTRWQIGTDDLSVALSVNQSAPGRGAALGALVSKGNEHDVRLLRITDDGGRIEVGGLIVAPSPVPCEALASLITAAGVSSGSVTLGLADGDGQINVGDDNRGCGIDL